MSIVSIIDCTLRDGGYLNNWKFDVSFQKSLINSLIESNVDVIECGFISDKYGSDVDGTHFQSIEKVNEFLRQNSFNNSASKFAVMMRVEEYDVETLPVCNKAENLVTTIRVMLYKNEIKQSINILKQIIKKGYDLHIQPTIISKYTDEEIVEMLMLLKSVGYKAISIVDTFGALNENEIKRITMIFDKYANNSALLSLHCHNNLSRAYQNALAYISSVNNKRDICVDVSINGIGRGGGNLSTEIFISYLKSEKKYDYSLLPIKNFSEKEMVNFNSNIKEQDFYAYMITAKKNMHPNYATFLLINNYSKSDILKILELILPEKYECFDYNYINSLVDVYFIKN